MNSAFYTDPVPYYIFALLLEDDGDKWSFVGKSGGQRISAVYSRHICGNVAATEGFFTHIDKPGLYILEDCRMTGSEAYRHVVAWTALFLKKGYAPLNHEGTIYDARDLHPEAQAIYDQISQRPFDEVLKSSYVANPADRDRKTEVLSCEEIPRGEKIRMCLRIDEYDKERFTKFCKSLDINQREGFSILLDRGNKNDVSGLQGVLSQLHRSVDTLKTENEKLRQKLKAATERKHSEAEQWARDQLLFVAEGIRKYLMMVSDSQENSLNRLPAYSYRKFTKNLPFGMTYDYPSEQGYLLLRLEAVLWGNTLHKACFYVGRDMEGKPVKLRYYSKSWFCGECPGDSVYGYEGALWLVGCKTAKDGAMEMVVALPIPEYPALTSEGADTYGDRPGQAALDDLIDDAMEW